MTTLYTCPEKTAVWEICEYYALYVLHVPIETYSSLADCRPMLLPSAQCHQANQADCLKALMDKYSQLHVNGGQNHAIFKNIRSS